MEIAEIKYDIGVANSHCKCVNCGEEFGEYSFTEDCWECEGEGGAEKEMEWEYEPFMYKCSVCKGEGCVIQLEKKRCRICKNN